ncbi:nucleolar protein [Neurospora sp. IMI 360204]|nr:nucleolar protein [Neurospora sp. IMI 360204]
MAPVTRSRRETKTTESPANKKSKTSTPKSDSKKPEKRKATEDATPVAAKKQKATKDAVAAPSPKPTPKTEKSTPKTTPKEEKKSTQKPVKENKKEKKEKPAQKEKKTKEPTPEPEAQEKEDDNEEEEEELDNETQALVENLDGDDEEKEDDKQISTFKKGQDVGKIPKKKTKDDKDASAIKGSGKRGVMYLGRIPHGFYEHEIRAYFGQFGEITRLRVVRNKKTGASRHRAFVEFADAEVADIAARTMDKYLLFGHILTAKVVPQAQVHKDLFKGANRRFKVIPWNKMAGKQLEKALPESKWQGKITKEEQRRAARAAKLAEMDYEWEAPQLKAAEAKEPALLTAAEEEPVKAIEAPAAAEEKTEEKAEPEAETKEEGKEEESKEEEEPKSTRKRAAATPKKAAATPKKAAGTTPKKAAAAPKAEATTPARATRSTRKTKA